MKLKSCSFDCISNRCIDYEKIAVSKQRLKLESSIVYQLMNQDLRKIMAEMNI